MIFLLISDGQQLFVRYQSLSVGSIGKEDNNSLWSLLFDEYSDFVSDAWSEEIEKAMLLCDKIKNNLQIDK